MHIIQKQLSYTRPHIPQEELGGAIPFYSPKIYIPDHFLNFLDDCSSMIVPMACRHSFFHCLLYALHPDYSTGTYLFKKTLVERFLSELTTPPNFPHLNTAYMNYIANKFDLNIFIIDKTRVIPFSSIFPTFSLYLYFDTMGFYHPISINKRFLL